MAIEIKVPDIGADEVEITEILVKVGDKVEAAYRRGDLFEKRRELMNAWATICTINKSFIFS